MNPATTDMEVMEDTGTDTDTGMVGTDGRVIMDTDGLDIMDIMEATGITEATHLMVWSFQKVNFNMNDPSIQSFQESFYLLFGVFAWEDYSRIFLMNTSNIQRQNFYSLSCILSADINLRDHWLSLIDTSTFQAFGVFEHSSWVWKYLKI